MVFRMNTFLDRIVGPLTASLFLVSLLAGLTLSLYLGPGGMNAAPQWHGLALILPVAVQLWGNRRGVARLFRKPAVSLALGLGLLGAGFLLLPAPLGLGAGGLPQFQIVQHISVQHP